MKITKKVLSVLLAVIILATAMALLAAPANALDVGDTIYFGTYPQTEVTATPALEAAADEAVWRSYGYYVGNDQYDGSMHPDDYMQFADFFWDGNKYRAVRFTAYRPFATINSSTANNSFQDKNGYFPDTTYYFQYTPLTWRVLDPSEGLILCESIIDAQAYQNMVWKRNDGTYFQASDTAVYTNDYPSSSIRQWLNHDFWETAFSIAQMQNIQTVTIENKGYYSAFDCADTTDPIYMLSTLEASSAHYGLSYASARKTAATDYAKCQGVFVYSSKSTWWWLRTPGDKSSSVCAVREDGSIYVSRNNACCPSFGVRPACRLNELKTDAALSDALYSADTVELSLSASPVEGGAVRADGAYEKGKAVTLTAEANTDYRFVGWYAGDEKISDDASFSYTVTGNAALTAKFESTVALVTVYATTSADQITGTGGTVTGSGTFEKDKPVTITASPIDGYLFEGWYGIRAEDGRLTDKQFGNADATFTLHEDTAFAALFVKIRKQTVTVMATEGGTVTGGGTFPTGQTVEPTAAASKGWLFVGWFEGDTMLSDSESFAYTVMKDAVLIARFTKDTRPSIAIRNYTADRTIDYRTTITFSVEPVRNPVAGGRIHWFIDGQDHGAADICTVKEAKKDFTVQAKYIQDDEVLAESQTESVKVNTGFFAKVKAFFRALFQALPSVVQEYLDAEAVAQLN